MKELVLIRHAKSSWKDETLIDFDRPLNKRGKENAPKMAKFLKRIVENPDLIISSPSKRTRLTLEYFLKEFSCEKEIIFEDKIYETPFLNLLGVLKNIDSENNLVFLIGHNPALNNLADFLLGGFSENIPTSGILKINLDLISWNKIDRKCGELDFFYYPKMLNI
jgi:phosphohistidine phosphatase